MQFWSEEGSSCCSNFSLFVPQCASVCGSVRSVRQCAAVCSSVRQCAAMQFWCCNSCAQHFSLSSTADQNKAAQLWIPLWLSNFHLYPTFIASHIGREGVSRKKSTNGGKWFILTQKYNHLIVVQTSGEGFFRKWRCRLPKWINIWKLPTIIDKSVVQKTYEGGPHWPLNDSWLQSNLWLRTKKPASFANFSWKGLTFNNVINVFFFK